MRNNTYFQDVIRSRPYGWEYLDSQNAPIHFSFEEMDHSYMRDLISATWRLPIYVGAAYILVIFGIQWWLKDKAPFQLKWPLFWWNLSLGVFSAIALARTLPSFLAVLWMDNGFYSSICVKQYMDIPSANWIIIFVCSKYIELGDTLFIVLTKRPLKFLQWYHHVITMYAAWSVAPDMEPVTRWYTVLNYFVHALMYNYFALKILGKKVPSQVANLITTLQFAQMVAAFFINTVSTYYSMSGDGCERYSSSIQIFALVYGSFIILFGKLFYDSVIKGGRRARETRGKKLE